MPDIDLDRPGIYPVVFFDERVFAAFSGRQYPRARFDEFLNHLRCPKTVFFRPKQTHGDAIWKVTEDTRAAEIEADGIMTHVPGYTLGIITADCVPVFLWDPVQKVAGLAHAGWRGLKAGILQSMVIRLRNDYQTEPGDLKVFLGPFIRQCCYEVGLEFLEYFPANYHPVSQGKGRLDTASVVRNQLARAGVREESIRDSGICTSCRNDAFYSARKGDADERILSVIQIKP